MEQILNYQKELFVEFTEKYKNMIEKLANKLNNKNIDMLNKFNNDFRVTINVLEELNVYLEDSNNPEIKNKLKEYKNMEETIKQFTPLLLINNIIKNIN